MGRKRRRTNWYFWGLILGLLAAGLAYVLIGAGLQSTTGPYDFRDLVIPRLIECLVAAWLFWVGSAVGSFLNVVAWRMPRGQSLNGFSHCPRCNHRLSARDNWPVFGWILLRGRCRTCRLPISRRYPIVELLVGLSLLLVGYVELQLGQANLPDAEKPNAYRGLLVAPIVSREVLGVALYHAIALSCSWAFGLIRFDDRKLPRSLVRFGLAVVIIPMLLWAPVMQVPWQATLPEKWPNWSYLDALMRVITAAVAAALLARAMARYVCPTADLKLDPMGQGTKRLVDLIIMLTIPAVIVGWQALFGVVIASSLLAAILHAFQSALLRGSLEANRDGYSWFAVSLPIVLALHLALWRFLESLVYWPSSQSPPWVIIVAAVLSLMIPAALAQPRAQSSQAVRTPASDDDDPADFDQSI